MENPRIDERYISFENIDCFENACVVIDNLLRVLENKNNSNQYWEKIVLSIPQAYYDRSKKNDKNEALLYFVCSNVFYLEELFEKADDETAMNSLRICELECC